MPYTFLPDPPLRPGRTYVAAIEAEPNNYGGSGSAEQIAFGVHLNADGTYDPMFRHVAYDGPESAWTKLSVCTTHRSFATAVWELRHYQHAFHRARRWVWLVPEPEFP